MSDYPVEDESDDSDESEPQQSGLLKRPYRLYVDRSLEIMASIAERSDEDRGSSRTSTDTDMIEDDMRQSVFREARYQKLMEAPAPKDEKAMEGFSRELRDCLMSFHEGYIRAMCHIERYREYHELKDLDVEDLPGLDDVVKREMLDIMERLEFFQEKADRLEKENVNYKQEFDRLAAAGFTRVDILNLEDGPDNGTTHFHFEPPPCCSKNIGVFEEVKNEIAEVGEKENPRNRHLIPGNYIEYYETKPKGKLTHVVDILPVPPMQPIKPVDTHLLNIQAVEDTKEAEFVQRQLDSGNIIVQEFPGPIPENTAMRDMAERLQAAIKQRVEEQESKEIILTERPQSPYGVLKLRTKPQMSASHICKIKAEVDARFKSVEDAEEKKRSAECPKTEALKVPTQGATEVSFNATKVEKDKLNNQVLPRDILPMDKEWDHGPQVKPLRKNARLKSAIKRPSAVEKCKGTIKVESPIPDLETHRNSPRYLAPLGERPPTRRKDSPIKTISQKDLHNRTPLGPIKSKSNTANPVPEKTKRADGEPAPHPSSIHFPFPPERTDGLPGRQNPRWRKLVNPRTDGLQVGPNNTTGLQQKLHTYEPPKPKVMRGRPLVTPGVLGPDHGPNSTKVDRSPELSRSTEKRFRGPDNTHASQSHSNVALGPIKDGRRSGSPSKKKNVSFDTVPQTVISQIDMDPVPQIRRSPNKMITRPPFPKKAPMTPVDQFGEPKSNDKEIILPKIVGSSKVLNSAPEKSASTSRLSTLQSGIVASKPPKPPSTPTARRIPTSVKTHFTPSPDRELLRGGSAKPTKGRSISCVVECYAYEDEEDDVGRNGYNGAV